MQIIEVDEYGCSSSIKNAFRLLLSLYLDELVPPAFKLYMEACPVINYVWID